jgi:pimeloyl-ACP methyl ester carboxylesterase
MAKPVVLAAHGITGTGVSWNIVRDQLGDDVTFIAPDLRGRGQAAAWGPPYGMAQHAADLVRLLDEQDVTEPVTVAGHSMGGFVAVVMAHLHPERVKNLVLVDGGLPITAQAPDPAVVDIDQILTAVIGPAIARLSMTFESRDAYRDFWKAHPSFAGDQWNDYVEEYVDYDLVGTEPELRSGVSIDAVKGDATDLFATSTLYDAIAALDKPAVLLRAEKGMMNDPTPLIGDDLVAQYPQVKDLGFVAGTNHYTIVLSDHGSKAVADAIRQAT